MKKARELLEDAQTVLPALQLNICNPLVYTNVDRVSDPTFTRWIHWIYTARQMVQRPVVLGRYPAGTLMRGGSPFAVMTPDGALVEEQAAAMFFDVAATRARLVAGADEALAVDRPCVLACRHGEWTWAHWLGDMLPKIVLAERAAPHRFTYVVPGAVTDPEAPGAYIKGVLDSLAVYGIAPHRLLRVRQGAVYRFAALFDLADMCADGQHPGVLAAMQDVTGDGPGRGDVVALMRHGTQLRPIVNEAAVHDALRAQGAFIMDPGQFGLAEKIAVMRAAKIVIGDIGSNLITAIYARPGTGMVTLGAANWDDNYFGNIFQRQGAFLADIRGVALPRGDEGPAHAPVVINPADVVAGVQAVAAAQAAPPGAPVVAGRMLARAPGGVVWRIRFGVQGDAGPHLASEFSAPEGAFTWSVGPVARLRVNGFVAPAHDCWLEVKGVGFVARPHLVSRPLAVSVNGVFLGEYDIDELTHLYFPAPAAVLGRSADLEIAFYHKVCPSPRDMGVSGDGRALGFMFEMVGLRVA